MNITRVEFFSSYHESLIFAIHPHSCKILAIVRWWFLTPSFYMSRVVVSEIVYELMIWPYTVTLTESTLMPDWFLCDFVQIFISDVQDNDTLDFVLHFSFAFLQRDGRKCSVTLYDFCTLLFNQDCLYIYLS